MNFDFDKFTTLVHYICDSCAEDPARLGKVKLNKVPWHVDVELYRRQGHSLTGERYIKGQYGPVADHLLEAVDALKDAGALAVRGVEYYGHDKYEFISLTRPDISSFSAQEIAVVDEMIRFVCDENTAASISAKTHDHIWEVAEIGETLPNYTVLARPGELTESDMAWAKSEARRLGHLI